MSRGPCREHARSRESRPIQRLSAHATRRENVYRHEWQLGDLLIWNNCGVMHRVIPYDPDSGRMMHRTTCTGSNGSRASRGPTDEWARNCRGRLRSSRAAPAASAARRSSSSWKKAPRSSSRTWMPRAARSWRRSSARRPPSSRPTSPTRIRSRRSSISPWRDSAGSTSCSTTPGSPTRCSAPFWTPT